MAGGLMAAGGTTPMAQEAPLGGPEDTAYAAELWALITKPDLVGENVIKVRPFEGSEPHGSIREVLAAAATIDGHSGRLLV